MRRSSRLRVEILEDRRVLSGNVNAFLCGDTLHIVGDQFDNSVQVWISQGLVAVIHTNGTINNTPADTQLFSTSGIAIPKIEVQTHAGDDVVKVLDWASAGQVVDLSIDTGAGADSIGFVHENYYFGGEGQALSGNVRISTGNGNDGVYVDGAGFDDHPFGFPDLNFDVDLGNGDDRVAVWNGPVRIASLVGGNGQGDSAYLSDLFFEQYQDHILGFETFDLY